MGRNRKHDSQLPPRVYRTSSGAYRYNPLGGKSITLASKKSTLKEIWAEYAKQTQSQEVMGLKYLAENYYQSNAFTTLKERTQKDYRDACSVRPLKAFAGWEARQIQPRDLHQYIKLRGQKSVRRANYELSWLKNVFGNAVREGLIDANPARELIPLRLTQTQKAVKKERRRYVSDTDYHAMLKVASPAVWVAMEISYCTGCRQGDVLKMRWEDISDALTVVEGKTDRKYNKAISPRLAIALEAAKKLPGHRFGGWIVRTRRGTRFTASGFQASYQKGRVQLKESQRFPFHSIRHKAITDAEGPKQEFSMHSDARMLGIYDHTIVVSPSN